MKPKKNCVCPNYITEHKCVCPNLYNILLAASATLCIYLSVQQQKHKQLVINYQR